MRKSKLSGLWLRMDFVLWPGSKPHMNLSPGCRSKKLSVPASVVSRIMGRGGCNITAIQDVTGAHIDVDKQKDKNGERMITIR